MPPFFFFFLGFLAILWSAIFVVGLKRPAALFFISVASISLINFSFFTGEISSRLSPPDVLFGTLLLVTFIRKALLKNEPLLLPKTPGIIFLILLAGIFLSFLSPAPHKNVLFGEGQPLSVVWGMILFLLVSEYVHSEKDVVRFLNAWTVSAAIAAVFALIDMRGMFSPFKGARYDLNGFFGLDDLASFSLFPHAMLSAFNFRIQGSFRTPGQLGIYAMTSFFVLLAFFLVPRLTRKKRMGLGALLPVMLLSCVLSTRVSVLPSLGLGIFLAFFYLGVRAHKKGFLFLGGFFFAAASVLILAASNKNFFVQTLGRDIGDLKKFSNLANLPHVASFITNQAAICITALKDHPLFGIGYGRFIHSDYHIFTRSYEIHSTPLQFLAETGVVGTSAYVIFLVYFLIRAFQNFRLSKNHPWRLFYAVLFFAMLSMPVSYLYNRHLRERTFWLFIALIYAGSRVAASSFPHDLRRESDPFPTPCGDDKTPAFETSALES